MIDAHGTDSTTDTDTHTQRQTHKHVEHAIIDGIQQLLSTEQRTTDNRQQTPNNGQRTVDSAEHDTTTMTNAYN